jgi:hypothetical protein
MKMCSLCFLSAQRRVIPTLPRRSYNYLIPFVRAAQHLAALS